MSDNTPTNTTTEADLAEATTTETEVETEATTEVETEDKPGREAARYRRQLREVETERDGLLTQLEGLRRAEAERLAGDHKIKPAALWAAGTQLADLLAEDGTVDPARVAEAATAAKVALGFPTIPSAPSAYGQGNVGVPVHSSGDGDGFEQAFGPKPR